MLKNELIIKDTHRALWYEDGVLVKVLEAGCNGNARIYVGFDNHAATNGANDNE